MRTSGRLRRSLLFVPGAEPRKLERARQAQADTLLFDLEDAVAPDAKAQARALVAATLRAGGFGDVEAAVRVNADPSTREADLAAVIAAGCRTVCVPKCESADGIGRVVAMLRALEARLGVPAAEQVRILALIETARGVLQALEVADADARVEALCFGHADFALDMGVPPDAGRGVLLHARAQVAMAAHAAGIAAIDTVHLAVQDTAAFRADVDLGVGLGFEGKLCIHPAQAAIVNTVLTPTPEQVAHAERVLAAWEAARAAGRGVFSLDGRMIDAPLVAAEERVLARARRAGVR